MGYLINKVILEKYKIVQEIEHSVMSRVFIGYEISTSNIVTIKILDESKLRDDIYLKRFFLEAKILNKIKHPNVIKLLDCGEVNGMHFLVTEQIKGQPLQNLMKMKKKISLDKLIDVMIQVGLVLDAIHSEHIIHRNLSPECILVQTNDQMKVKVSGFDIARETFGDYRTCTSLHENSKYSSPEQIFGKEIDHTTDIYSMGAILYEIITGVIPVIRSEDEEIPPPHTKSDKVPEELENIIVRCLKIDKEKRFSRVYDLNIALQKFRDAFFSMIASQRAYAKDSLGLLLENQLKSLNSLKKSECEAALDVLKDVDDKRAYKIIYFALKNRFWSIRKLAAEILISKGNIIIETVSNYVDFGNDDISYWTLRIIEKIGSRESDDLLAKFLLHKNQDIKSFAIKTIGEIQSFTNIEKLIPFLNSKFWLLRKDAADVLIKFGESAIPILEKYLNSKDHNTQFWVINCISKIKQKNAVSYFDKLYSQGNEDLKNYIIMSFKNIDSRSVDDFLIEKFGKESWAVNRQIIEVLCSKGEYVASKLNKIMNSTNSEELKYNSLKIITRILGINSLEILENILLDDDSKIRAFAVRALGEIKSLDSLRILIDFFEDKSWIIRSLASDSIAKIGSLSLDLLNETVKSNNPDVRYWAIQTMGKMGTQALGALIKVFKNGTSTDKLQVIPVLGCSKNKRIIDLLVSAFDDPKWVIRNVAAETLINIGPKVIPHLLKVIVGKSKDKCFWARKILLNFETETIDKLTPMMFTKVEKQKILTITALMRLQTDNSSKFILNLITKGDSYTKKLVITIINQVGEPKEIVKLIDLSSSEKIKKLLANILNKKI